MSWVTTLAIQSRAPKKKRKRKQCLTLPGECSKFLQVDINSSKIERKKIQRAIIVHKPNSFLI
jgi:hypothetical protein